MNALCYVLVVRFQHMRTPYTYWAFLDTEIQVWKLITCGNHVDKTNKLFLFMIDPKKTNIHKYYDVLVFQNVAQILSDKCLPLINFILWLIWKYFIFFTFWIASIKPFIPHGKNSAKLINCQIYLKIVYPKLESTRQWVVRVWQA